MSKTSELLTVVKVSEERTDKNGRNYKVVTFQSPNTIEIVDATTGELLNVRVPARTTSMVRYQESYLNDQMEYLYDATVGEKIPGKIVTEQVAPYEINGREVNTYTTAVLGMTNDSAFDAEIVRAFRSAGHDLLSQEEASSYNPVSVVKQTKLDVNPVEEDAAF